MFHYLIKAGTVDVSVVLRVVDSVDGTPETGVDHATTGLDLKYRREGAANVDLTEAALAALTTAHTDGGVEQIGNGYIRVDLPDAACATGATGVLVHGVATGMVIIGCYIQLVTFDPFDTVRLGLTALPNAAAEAAGGLFTRGTGAGQINQDANGRIDANVINARGLASGVVTTGGTTTSIPTSSLVPSAAVTDQFKGRIVIFDRNTTTANLRGQATDITASTSGGVLTVTALTTAPVDGDAFIIV